MPPKKGPKPYKMPPPLPKNEVLTDTGKRKWLLGPSIGKGGFGEIYAAAQGEKTPVKDTDYCYVIKIEPHENGPLFCEKNFYARVGKSEDVSSWMSTRKLKTFGMPIMHGFGSHECGSIKYRFLVMDRYSKDLWSLFNSCNKVFPLATVLQVSSQVVDVYEYIHSQSYVHADVKGANLLLGLKKGTENQVYAVDYGLAARFTTTEFKTDPKKAHNGTIEYTSRDAHAGVITRRGDMEILAFNIVHWLSSKLPWEGKLDDAVAVQKAKESAMKNVTGFLKDCFGKKPIPEVVSKYVKYVSEMQYNDAPDYSKVKKMFIDGLKVEGVKLDSPLRFTKPLEQQNGVSKVKKVRTSPRKLVKSSQRNNGSSSGSRQQEVENNHSDDDMFIDSESEDEDESLSRKKLKSSKTKPKNKVDSGEEEESTSKKRKAKPKPVEKPSWKDCPTARLSKVVRAGEYVSESPKRKKKE